MDRFMEKHTQSWFDQPLCHKNRDEVVIKNNWFFREHNFPTLAMVYCKNSTENNNWCKPKEEVDFFVGNHPSYFAH